MSKHGLQAIDLFAGSGGLSLGLKQASFRLMAAVEIDAMSVETYRANHPDVAVWLSDIRITAPTALLSAIGLDPGELDLLAGCPPCQGFSTMRTPNRASSVPDDRND